MYFNVFVDKPHTHTRYAHPSLYIRVADLPSNYSDLKQCRPQPLSPQKRETLLLINNFYKSKMV